MGRALISGLVGASVIAVSFGNLSAQARVDSGTLIEQSRRAVVRVIASTSSGKEVVVSTGTGFLVSQDGHIVTCNHVVAIATPDGNGTRWQYHQNIRVILSDASETDATVVGTLSRGRVMQDYALLKIDKMPPAFLPIGELAEAKLGDDLIIWGFPLGLPGPVLIKGSVATTISQSGDGVVVRALVFQGPNNKGMSGGPVIHARTGRVLGVTSNRIAGIGKELDDTRNHIRAVQSKGSVRFMGVDPNAAILALTDTLDKFLMSGMGVAIAVEQIHREISQTVQQK